MRDPIWARITHSRAEKRAALAKRHRPSGVPSWDVRPAKPPAYRCLACTYPLVGVPTTGDGERATVACPECGREHKPVVLNAADLEWLEAHKSGSLGRPSSERERLPAFILTVLIAASGVFVPILPWLFTLPVSGYLVAQAPRLGWGAVALHVLFAFIGLALWL